MSDINENVLDLFKKATYPGSEKQSIGLYISFEKPSYINYRISEFLSEGSYIHSLDEMEAFINRKNIYGCVDANYSFECEGIVEGVHFKGSQCRLSINYQANSEYLIYSKKGLIGTGSFDKDQTFSFILYLSPQFTKNILDRSILANALVQNYSDSREKDYWQTVDLSLVNYRLSKRTKGEVVFDIIAASFEN